MGVADWGGRGEVRVCISAIKFRGVTYGEAACTCVVGLHRRVEGWVGEDGVGGQCGMCKEAFLWECGGWVETASSSQGFVGPGI